MNRIQFLLYIFLFNLTVTFGQSADPGFAKHLTDKAYYEDIILLGKLDWGHLEQAELDSMNYYTGWAYYNLQMLEEGISSFSSVSRESDFLNASRFFAAWCELYQKNPAKAIIYLDQTENKSTAEKELFDIFSIGGSLMQGNIQKTDSLLLLQNNTNKLYKPQWDRMNQHYVRLLNFHPKSYATAGILSGIIPGLGKFYTGQKGAGASSLIIAGGLAAISLENGIKTGWKSWNTILAASIFTIFYVGNIYGSVVSVKVYRERFNNELDRAVLLDLNIPLRNIFR